MSKRAKPRRGNATDCIEWVGGSKSLPVHVTEGDPHRPELAVWLQFPEGIVVGHEILGEDASRVSSMRRAMDTTATIPQRVRVADDALASEVRAEFGDRIDVRVAPTPELDALFEELVRSLPDSGEPPSYFEGGRVEERTIARMFRAAEALYRVAPWKVASSDQAVRIDIPALGVEGACVSILGQLGESFGLLVFPSYVAFERFASADAPPPLGRDIDLGTAVLALDFERGAEMHHAMRTEITRHGWSVAGPNAYPVVMIRDRDGVSSPAGDRDVQIATECALALTSFFVRHRKIFSSEIFEPVRESSTIDGVKVRITAPYDADGEFDVPVGPPAVARMPAAAANKAGRNDPCPCGSGKKYKKCCLVGEQTERTEVRRNMANHELDRGLVESIHRYAIDRFGDAWRDAVGEIADSMGEDEAIWQLLAPFTAYTLEIDGKPALEWFVDGRGRSLSPHEHEWLEAQRRSWLSVWEIVECEPGVAVVVRDLLSGETRRVAEVKGSRTLVRRDAVLVRAVTFGDVSVFCGMFPRTLPPDVAAAVVEKARRRLRSKGAIASSRLRSAALGCALIGWWADAVFEHDAQAARPRKLVNTDGEDLLLTTDHFAFEPKARARVEAALRTMDGVISPENGDPGGDYAFARPGNAIHAHWDNTIVGHASVADAGLRVDTNSIARADRLRRLVEDACGGLLRHRIREHADPLSTSADGSPPFARESEPQPPEVAEVLREMKRAHYQSWLDQPVPALDGKTPREAARTKRGRGEVDLLLRTMENHEQRRGPEGAFDFGEVRSELGLTDA